MFFGPNQSPRPILTGKFAGDFVCAIMRMQTGLKIIGLPDIEAALGIFQDVNPIHGQSKKNSIPTLRDRPEKMAPEVGLEPTTSRLTAARSTIELLWNPKGNEFTSP